MSFPRRTLGIRQALPTCTEVDVEVGPLAAGTIEFKCAAGLWHGRLVVKRYA
jgi:hypothetical protein